MEHTSALRARRVAVRPHAVLPAIMMTAAAALLSAQSPGPRVYTLDGTTGLRLHNVTASPATLDGKPGVRIAGTERAGSGTTSPQPSAAPVEQLALVEGLEFGNGLIEAEIAGAVAEGAPAGARGFVGIAFRVLSDLRTYDAFYLRPTNGRAEDQERRNHSAQYISHPDWPWFRLRKEFPSKYESYVDLVPGAWTSVRIDVSGAQARLFVHGQAQPTLIVNDLRTGAQGRGGVALWIDQSTVAHFRNLRVTTTEARSK